MTPSKSIPQKSNHDLKERYTYARVGTLESKPLTDILKKTAIFCHETVLLINGYTIQKSILNHFLLFVQNFNWAEQSKS